MRDHVPPVGRREGEVEDREQDWPADSGPEQSLSPQAEAYGWNDDAEDEQAYKYDAGGL